MVYFCSIIQFVLKLEFNSIGIKRNLNRYNYEDDKFGSNEWNNQGTFPFETLFWFISIRLSKYHRLKKKVIFNFYSNLKFQTSEMAGNFLEMARTSKKSIRIIRFVDLSLIFRSLAKYSSSSRVSLKTFEVSSVIFCDCNAIRHNDLKSNTLSLSNLTTFCTTWSRFCSQSKIILTCICT